MFFHRCVRPLTRTWTNSKSMWNIFFWWLLLESQRKRTSELSVNIMRATDFNSKGLNKHKVDIHRLFNKLHGFRDSVLMRQIFKQILFSSLVRLLCWIPIIFCLYHCKDPWIMTITLTSKNSKEAEHDWIEKAKAHGQGVLVDDSRDDEHGEHGSCSEFPFWQLWRIRERNERVWIKVQGSGWFSGEFVSLELQEEC